MSEELIIILNVLQDFGGISLLAISFTAQK